MSFTSRTNPPSGPVAPWRLADLVKASLRVQSGLGSMSGESRRIQWRPTERLVRYYTTLGLIDGPTHLQGRVAYYGLRHLRQLLAIKQLQARGVSLRDVQARLAGLPDAQLERIAGLTDGWERAALQQVPGWLGPAEASCALSDPTASAVPFWERVPQVQDEQVPDQVQRVAAADRWSGWSVSEDLMVLLRDVPIESLDREQMEVLLRPLVEYVDQVRSAAEGRAQ